LLSKEILPPPYVPPPSAVVTMQIIDRTAQAVLLSGTDFEQRILKTTAPNLSFLSESDENHKYYLWKVYELFASILLIVL
jgi:hypothetical protein